MSIARRFIAVIAAPVVAFGITAAFASSSATASASAGATVVASAIASAPAAAPVRAASAKRYVPPCSRIYYTGSARRPTSLQAWCHGTVIKLWRDFKDRKEYIVNIKRNGYVYIASLMVSGQARIIVKRASAPNTVCFMFRTLSRQSAPQTKVQC